MLLDSPVLVEVRKRGGSAGGPMAWGCAHSGGEGRHSGKGDVAVTHSHLGWKGAAC